MIAPASLAYVEPGINDILVLSSFVLLLNFTSFVLDNFLYCGLIGQIFLGVAWGTPGGGWLSNPLQTAIVQLGYLGLILLVFEGGLSISFSALKANLSLSICVALTGITLPIAFSFVLVPLTGISSLGAFAAGAALCSTSLGTTFTVLQNSGLTSTRLGVVLISAAMVDDVVGLVLVQIVSDLSSTAQGSPFAPGVVLRPLLVSAGFAICVPVSCYLVVRPVSKALIRQRTSKPRGWINRALRRGDTGLIIQTTTLVAFVDAASYSGTSNLFAAFLAGAVISWWETELSSQGPSKLGSSSNAGTLNSDPIASSGTEISTNTGDVRSAGAPEGSLRSEAEVSGRNANARTKSEMTVYEHYYKQPVETILKPFFFASIGFSIPISRMFTGPVIWKGFVYTVLMMVGKLMCGIWLIRINMSQSSLSSTVFRRMPIRKTSENWKVFECWPSVQDHNSSGPVELAPRPTDHLDDSEPATEVVVPQKSGLRQGSLHQGLPPSPSPTCDGDLQPEGQTPSTTLPTPRKPISLYPTTVLGCAMVARGEIGFLISAVAEAKGLYDSQHTEGTNASQEETFLVITWAIVLCTVIGPLLVGTLVTRVKKLEHNALSSGGGNTERREDVMGVWGVS